MTHRAPAASSSSSSSSRAAADRRHSVAVTSSRKDKDKAKARQSMGGAYLPRRDQIAAPAPIPAPAPLPAYYEESTRGRRTSYGSSHSSGTGTGRRRNSLGVGDLALLPPPTAGFSPQPQRQAHVSVGPSFASAPVAQHVTYHAPAPVPQAQALPVAQHVHLPVPRPRQDRTSLPVYADAGTGHLFDSPEQAPAPAPAQQAQDRRRRSESPSARVGPRLSVGPAPQPQPAPAASTTAAPWSPPPVPIPQAAYTTQPWYKLTPKRGIVFLSLALLVALLAIVGKAVLDSWDHGVDHTTALSILQDARGEAMCTGRDVEATDLPLRSLAQWRQNRTSAIARMEAEGFLAGANATADGEGDRPSAIPLCAWGGWVDRECLDASLRLVRNATEKAAGKGGKAQQSPWDRLVEGKDTHYIETVEVAAGDAIAKTTVFLRSRAEFANRSFRCILRGWMWQAARAILIDNWMITLSVVLLLVAYATIQYYRWLRSIDDRAMLFIEAKLGQPGIVGGGLSESDLAFAVFDHFKTNASWGDVWALTRRWPGIAASMAKGSNKHLQKAFLADEHNPNKQHALYSLSALGRSRLEERQREEAAELWRVHQQQLLAAGAVNRQLDFQLPVAVAAQQ